MAVKALTASQSAGVSDGLCRRRPGRRTGLVAYLNTHLDRDAKQCKVSPRTRLFALIIATMADPRALYRLEEFYHDQDCACRAVWSGAPRRGLQS